MEDDGSPFRGRGRWLGDLALIAAAGTLARRRTWTAVLVATALVVSALLGVNAPAFQVTAALVLAPLLSRAPPDGDTGRAVRGVRSFVGLVMLVALGWLLGAGPLVLREEGIVGPLALVACWFAAAGVRPAAEGARRWAAVVLLFVALAALALALHLHHLDLPGRVRAVRGSPVVEMVVLVVLAWLARRGPWLLWALVVSVVLKFVRIGVSGHEEAVFWLAGPVAVAFAARVGEALRSRDLHSAADAAAARIARALQQHPWRRTLAVTLVAFVIAFSFWMALAYDAPVSPRGRQIFELGWFALPGPFTIAVAVLFHALARAESLTDRLAAVVGPLLAVAGGLGSIVFLLALERGEDFEMIGEVVLVYTGLGPLLPALVGLAMARLADRRVSAWPAVVSLLCTCAVIVACLVRDPIVDEIVQHVAPDRMRSRIAPLFAIPWLLAFHRLVRTDASVLRMIAWSAALALATGIVVLLVAGGGLLDRGLTAASVATLVLATFGMAAIGVSLARRLRGITALPEDHAVLHWSEAMGRTSA